MVQLVRNLRVNFPGAIHKSCQGRNLKKAIPAYCPFCKQSGIGTSSNTGLLEELLQSNFLFMSIINACFVNIADHAVSKPKGSCTKLYRNSWIQVGIRAFFFFKFIQAVEGRWIKDFFKIIVADDPLVMPTN